MSPARVSSRFPKKKKKIQAGFQLRRPRKQKVHRRNLSMSCDTLLATLRPSCIDRKPTALTGNFAFPLTHSQFERSGDINYDYF